MIDPFVLFLGDICWGKCQSRNGKIRSLVTKLRPGKRVAYLCDNCFGTVSTADLERLAVYVDA